MYTLFPCFGAGPHLDEVEFSVRTLLYRCGDDAGQNVLIYTDSPERFRHLAVRVEEISAAQWREWGGPSDFVLRRKISALDHALQQTQSAVVMIDGDTWIRRQIRLLEARVAPGRGVMHICEGQISRSYSPSQQKLSALLASPEGAGVGIPSDVWMWNSGVVGLHPADRHLLPEVIRLTDILCQQTASHLLEQIAFTWVLQNNLRLSEAADVVFHYWPPYLREPFRMQLPEVLRCAREDPAIYDNAWVWQQRPQPDVKRRMKFLCKWAMRRLGLGAGYCRSNEW